MRMDDTREVHAIVAGGGSGLRFGGAKWDAPLGQRRMLDYALRPLAMCRPAVRSITLLLPESALGGEPPPLPAGVAFRELPGGATRADTVLRGLEAVRRHAGEDAWVLVHDVARPCVWRSNVEKLLREADADGGLLAVPVTDSVKRAEEGRVAASEDRQGLWRAQTPQLFELATLIRCLRQAQGDGVEVTDESRAMEHGGYRPRLIAGCEDNIKVTWPEDLARAESILQQDPDHAYWARL